MAELTLWAHRGSHGPGGPLENTLPAFERALAEGADGVELDVHPSRDGVPRVFHDETLERLVPGDPRALAAVDAVERAHAHGCRANVWTVNDAALADHLAALGVDGVFTDHPAELRNNRRR